MCNNKSHHQHFPLPNFYFPGMQSITCNSHYVVLFNMPAEKMQILSMSTQMFTVNAQHMYRVNEVLRYLYGYMN